VLTVHRGRSQVGACPRAGVAIPACMAVRDPYAFSSAGNNNGSAFFRNLGRHPVRHVALALHIGWAVSGRSWRCSQCGSLAAKKRIPVSDGTMRDARREPS